MFEAEKISFEMELLGDSAWRVDVDKLTRELSWMDRNLRGNR
jgi:hypothetical protein